MSIHMNPTLTKLCTVHGIDMRDTIAACVENLPLTLVSFKGRKDALSIARKSLKDGDTMTHDDAMINADAMKDDNRADVRSILKAAAKASRLDRALMVTLATRGM
jgi:L-rhamnose isomerase